MRYLTSFVALSALVSILFVSGCSRYDYYPRGIHQNGTKPIISKDETAYVVKLGDTLYSISKRFDVDLKLLAANNNVSKPYLIFVGQRLFIHKKAPFVGVRKNTKPVKKAVKLSVSKPKWKKKEKHPVASHGKVKLIWPTKGALTSRFGPRKGRMHDGIDIGSRAGIEVVAAAAGKVVYADSRLSGYGNLIIIRHTTDMFTAYAHNQKNLVSRGDRVQAGQHIADVGSSGRATGPHLHFEVRRGETAVDPLAYLPKR